MFLLNLQDQNTTLLFLKWKLNPKTSLTMLLEFRNTMLQHVVNSNFGIHFIAYLLSCNYRDAGNFERKVLEDLIFKRGPSKISWAPLLQCFIITEISNLILYERYLQKRLKPENIEFTIFLFCLLFSDPHHQGWLQPEVGRVGRPLQVGCRGQGQEGRSLLIGRRPRLGKGEPGSRHHQGLHQVPTLMILYPARNVIKDYIKSQH